MFGKEISAINSTVCVISLSFLPVYTCRVIVGSWQLLCTTLYVWALVCCHLCYHGATVAINCYFSDSHPVGVGHQQPNCQLAWVMYSRPCAPILSSVTELNRHHAFILAFVNLTTDQKKLQLQLINIFIDSVEVLISQLVKMLCQKCLSLFSKKVMSSNNLFWPTH